MGTPLTVKLSRPVRAVHMAGPVHSMAGSGVHDGAGPKNATDQAMADLQKQRAEMEQQQRHLAQTCQVLDDLACKVTRFYEEMVATHRTEIARLAVEIARRVLAQKVRQGDYEVESIIQEALEKAPAKQGVTIHVSPQDYEDCQRLQQERPDSPWACLTFVADPSIGQAQCLVETPRGIVKSVIEEHLEKIQVALEKAE
jgi:flagellar biosynthesis/type III secretory pathway protein FliH